MLLFSSEPLASAFPPDALASVSRLNVWESAIDLFHEMHEAQLPRAQPLAARMRPRSLDEFVSLPECQLALAQAVTYIATAPKSNAATLAIGKAREDVRSGRTLPVPVHLRDTHYAGSDQLSHGADYKYDHDFPEGWAGQAFLPEERRYYLDRQEAHTSPERQRRDPVAGAPGLWGSFVPR